MHTRIQISSDAFAHNFALLQQLSNKQVLPVVKANGYGLGIAAILQCLQQLPCPPKSLCVSTLDEAIELQELGWQYSIVLLGALSNDDIQQARHRDIAYWHSNLQQLQATLNTTSHSNTDIHLNLDTGMGRLGFQTRDIHEAIVRLQKFKGRLHIATHYPNADINTEQNSNQQELWEHMLRKFSIAADRYSLATIHACNTAATLKQQTTAAETHVRCGIGLYGVTPNPAMHSSALKPVMQWQVPIAEIRHLPRAQGISYGHEFVTSRPTKIAVLPVGYADGLPVAGAEQIKIQIGEFQCNFAGRITMDTALLDVTQIPDSQLPDSCIVMGAAGNTVADWAAASGRNTYEILTGLGQRPQRIVLN